jgi:pyruvate formate lyase activating enzyme
MENINEKLAGETWNLWKWSKEAYHYKKSADSVQCSLCPNGCILKNGQKSACHNRINKNGRLYSIAYGNPCSVHIDPVEKKPLYHYLPGSGIFSLATAGCNLHCLNCQNRTISQVGPEETENIDLMPDEAVDSCISNNCSSIAYTYTEPISFYEYVYDTSKSAHEKGIRNVLISNGYINETPLRELAKYINAANINLKSFKDSIYRKMNYGKLEPVKKTLLVLKEEKVWLEITNLIVPEWTDDLSMIKEMCKWLYQNDLHEFPLHFSRFTPMYKLSQLPSTPVSVLDKAYKIAKDEGIKYVHVGNVPGHFSENTYCHKCNKIVVERKGFRIAGNYIVNGKCKYCGEKIPGVWS